MLSPLQEKLLEMQKWFHNYCVDNGIRYYAVGGTMLGAIRHQGFIPWDDDVDIAVPRKDYERLIQSFTETIDGYLLESPYSGNEDYLYTYSKLYDTRTTLVEKARKQCRRGVYLDVFPLDGIGDTLKEAKKQFRKFDIKNMFLMSRTCVIRKDRSWYKNLSIVGARAIPRLFVNEKKLSKKLDKLAASMNKESSVYVANLMGAYRDKEIALRSSFGTPTKYSFEDIEIYGPEHYEEYLSGVYGNWREMPPKESRYTKHDYVVLDLNKSFL